MRGRGGGRVGHAPGRKVVCVGRHGDKGMRMERVEGKGWGRGEIKVHTVRHTDKVPEGALSLAHNSPAWESRARGEHDEPQG